jgi:carboxymethylenebutenolidase
VKTTSLTLGFTPQGGEGPGVLVLHEWWGLTEPFKQACDRLAEARFVALAPDFYRGKTTASIEEAEALGAELDRNVKRWRGDIVGALQFLRQLVNCVNVRRFLR